MRPQAVEIKQLSAQLASIKSDINRQEELLEECATYKAFLAQLTPKAWLQVCPAIAACVAEDQLKCCRPHYNMILNAAQHHLFDALSFDLRFILPADPADCGL